MSVRIIPRLDIKGPNLVKGVHLEGLRVLGKPEEFARHYYENGADELMFMDVVASLYNRNSLHDIITKVASEIFIPLTVGGGLRTLEDIKEVLRSGADKVAINTAAINNPTLIEEAASKFGSSTIAVSIEAIRQETGEYLAFTDNGREYTGKEVVAWAREVESKGAGEIILTSVDREGTGRGFDHELVKSVSTSVNIPVVACGGAGKKEDVSAVILDAQADAVSLASLLHYEYLKGINIGNIEHSEGNLDFLKSGAVKKNIQSLEILELKQYLSELGINCRCEIS